MHRGPKCEKDYDDKLVCELRLWDGGEAKKEAQ